MKLFTRFIVEDLNQFPRWQRQSLDLGVVVFYIKLLVLCLLLPSCIKKEMPKQDKIGLSLWDRGVKVASDQDSTKFAYLWFYEWHLFDAIKKGEHTSGRRDWQWQVDLAKNSALMDAGWLKLKIDATDSGADMLLSITNNSGHEWPDIAAMIPCLNPGYDRGNTDAVENPLFFDDTHENTWFLGDRDLELTKGDEFPREIHFNQAFISPIMAWEKEREDGAFVFSYKWPTSERYARAGLMIRESDDHKWVMGIAWEDFLSVQGYNPWKCMHLSVRIGPLARGEKKTIKGKIYLFEGTKEDCLERYRQDF